MYSRIETVITLSALSILVLYHVYLIRKEKTDPLATSFGIINHARILWVREVMKDKNGILAIQTLRNQIMASTFLASTAILICMGLINAAFRPGAFSEVSHALNLFGTRTETLWMLKLMLLGLLYFITFFNFTLSIRYNNHAGFMINTSAENDPAVSAETVTRILNRGALHYMLGMRGYYLSVPLALWLFGPIWMLSGSLALVIVLYRLDRKA